MTTRRTLTILAWVVVGAMALAWIAGCASTDRQWRESQTVLEHLPR
jgi:hypothetical protein